MTAANGRRRVVVENPTPVVDGGRIPIKRIVGDVLTVDADVFADGHDELDVRLRWRPDGPGDAGAPSWREVDMKSRTNDRWRASFPLESLGGYRYTVTGWIDRLATWQRDLRARVEAGQDIAADLLIGADIVRAAADRASAGEAPADAGRLAAWADELRAAGTGGPLDPRDAPALASDTDAAPADTANRVRDVTGDPPTRTAVTGDPPTRTNAAAPGQPPAAPLDPPAAPGEPPAAPGEPPAIRLALDPDLTALAHRHPDRSHATTWEPDLEVIVDRERARFSAWYELFPRSASPDPARHGTFRDVIARLPYVAGMGFDVLYLPPIHPIGLSHRKGPNNTVGAGPNDPGVPWAIGSPEGGHTAIHPALGTTADFEALVAATREAGMEIALDIAFQASPDHPWVAEHPEWFRHRPDGSVQYAENPPKKYQDIYPFDFETEAWRELWDALEGVFRFWIERGVAIFRVDNPHTKPFAFWEWVIARLRHDHPDVLFLAEAFTRPRVMQRLAKIGFTQSYTYFTWRNSKAELTQYFRELTTAPLVEFYRPNAWPNTPDILHEVLQVGGRPMFEARFVLAAALSAAYGIYGPAFELGESKPLEPGSEEYRASEKYQQRTWDLARRDSLAPLITRMNAIRRAHPALQRNEGLRFHSVDNDQLLAFTKSSPDGADIVLVVVNLDPRRAQGGTVELPLADLGLDATLPFEVSDELNGERYLWQGPRNPVELRPGHKQAHVFAVYQSRRSEQQFETYR